MAEVYLDIETTGLSPVGAYITVIGIFRCDGGASRLVQLVGEEVTKENLIEALAGAEKIYTYNGSRFDLPFIACCLGIDLEDVFEHRDLMYDCWRNNLYGGFKAVEQQLRIPRKLQGIGGYDAVLLWFRYKNYSDRHALNLLLEYNKEDVLNLKALKENLHLLCEPIEEN
jgi:uncharacterized protein YprB with RNaseH-like and TPR domain